MNRRAFFKALGAILLTPFVSKVKLSTKVSSTTTQGGIDRARTVRTKIPSFWWGVWGITESHEDLYGEWDTVIYLPNPPSLADEMAPMLRESLIANTKKSNCA
jgi:hypothetical protein